MQIEALVPPRRFVLEVIPGHHYTCTYGTAIAVPPGSPPRTGVFLSVPSDEFDISRPWPISVSGGRAIAYKVGWPRITALRLVQDPEFPDLILGAFLVEVLGQTATVEMTAPLPPGEMLVSAGCSRDVDGRIYSVLAAPRRMVFEVVPLNDYICDARARPGSLPPTDTPSGAPPDATASWWPMVFAVVAGVVAARLLVGGRARRDT